MITLNILLVSNKQQCGRYNTNKDVTSLGPMVGGGALDMTNDLGQISYGSYKDHGSWEDETARARTGHAPILTC